MLHGRQDELARIRELMSSAAQGDGGALTIVGDAGSGKSALLAAAAAEAHGMRVLRTQGVESEAPLAFAALQRLVQPLLPYFDQLPDPQARALRAAVAHEPAGGGDRFLVFLGALSLLSEAAQDAPVLVIVDDAHWLDEASAAALLFVARRLEFERIAVLFGARQGDVRVFDAGDLPLMQLGGLPLDAATRVLRDQTRIDVSPEVSAQLLASTGGNPLALVELPRILTRDQLTGLAVLPGRLPITTTMERVFLDRARRLSAAAQSLLLIAAADDSASLHTLTAAAGGLGLGTDTLAELETADLLQVDGSSLQLRHPLVRSAVYSASTTHERTQVHAALAKAFDEQGDPDRRAWHRALSVSQPDLAVVADLEAAAVRAERRGGYEAASAAWERAAELSTEARDRARRHYRAGMAAWVAGRPARAAQLVDIARTDTPDPLVLADSARLRARVEWNTGSVQTAHRMLLEAARDVASHDSDRAREIAAEAAAIAAFGGDSGMTFDAPTLIPHPATDATARDRCYSELLQGLNHVVAGELEAGGAHLARSFDIAEELTDRDYQLLPNLAVAAWHVGDFQQAAVFNERLLAAARSSGTMVMVLYALTRLLISDFAAGRWATLDARATEAMALGEETRQEILGAAPRGWQLVVAASRGDVDGQWFDNEVAELTERAGSGVLGPTLRDLLRWANGTRSTESAATAFHHMAQMSQDYLKRLAAMDRIEAAVRAGHRETAELWVADMERFSEVTGQPWAAAVSAHGRALLSDGDTATAHFERALQHFEEATAPFHQARTRLAYGEALRRNRRRVDARGQLRAALDAFNDLGAAPWAERASQELRASGETAQRRDNARVPKLTPQELQVAQFVQRGLSNKDVAAQLFLSPRTVDFHLRNVFAKTGVTSRVELARLDLD